MRTAIGLILLLAAVFSSAQQIPSGTILPTMLDNTLDSSSTKPGQQISAKLRQDVSLPNGQKMKRNAKVLGHVVRVWGGNPASITVQFDRVEMGKGPVSIAVTLRALASMEVVSDAKIPPNPNSGYGTTSWDWNMLLIGGQAAFNGQRVVKSQDGKGGRQSRRTRRHRGRADGQPLGRLHRRFNRTGVLAFFDRCLRSLWLQRSDHRGIRQLGSDCSSVAREDCNPQRQWLVVADEVNENPRERNRGFSGCCIFRHGTMPGARAHAQAEECRP